MKLFKRKEKETRAETMVDQNNISDPLLSALLNPGQLTRDDAMQIPTVASAVSLIGQVIANTPIRLYKMTENGVEEVKDDYRVRLLNEETGDTLSANDFWKAIVEDYYLGDGAYVYINKKMGKIQSLHYVEDKYVSIQKNFDPIFKDYDIMVDGNIYKPWDFLKILRNSKDGCSGTSMIKEQGVTLSVAYNTMVFEQNIVEKGGNKKGFLKSSRHLTKDAMDMLKAAFKRLYGNNEENVVVLNDGIEFQESSNTMVEMQLNERKKTNSEEIGKIFHVSPQLLNSTSASVKPESEISKFAKLTVIPVLNDIECSLNRDLLMENEKETMYFAADTKELLKGDMKERFEAYKTAIEGHIMTIDECREKEDLPDLGLDFLQLSLGNVLYNTKTKEIYTPNTGETQNIDDLKNQKEEPTAEEPTVDDKDVIEKGGE